MDSIHRAEELSLVTRYLTSYANCKAIGNGLFEASCNLPGNKLDSSSAQGPTSFQAFGNLAHILLAYHREEILKIANGFKEIALENNNDNIRPAHYGGIDNTYEVIKVIDAWELGFNLGNVVKYVARAGKKDTSKELEDLQKAKTYLEFQISSVKKKQAGQPLKIRDESNVH